MENIPCAIEFRHGSWYKGEIQNGNSYSGKYTKVLIKAYVDPINVDWEETLVRNAYNLREEREIYIPYNSPIEIFEIVTKNGKLPLTNSIIVNT